MEIGLTKKIMILIFFILCLHFQGEATKTKGTTEISSKISSVEVYQLL